MLLVTGIALCYNECRVFATSFSNFRKFGVATDTILPEKGEFMTKQPLEDLFDAMYHGKHSFEDFLHSEMSENYIVVPPGKEGKRTLFKPKENLKVYQRFLNLFLFEFLPINERAVFSYRKGFSAINAVEIHKNGKFFFQTDISAFFESINESLTKKTILEGSSQCPVSDVDKYIDRIIEIVCIGNSLPIGLPSSALLSNCVLFEFDNLLEEVCRALGLFYSRYADDIIVSGQEKEKLAGMDVIVQDKLHSVVSETMNINRSKTKFFQVGGKIKILGLMILPNGKVSPDTKKRREVEIMLHLYVNNRQQFNKMIESAKERAWRNIEVSDEDYTDILSGNLNYVDSIDPDYTNKLRRKFGAATVDMLIHKGFSNKK